MYLKSNKILKHFRSERYVSCLVWICCIFPVILAISVFSLKIFMPYIFHNLIWYVCFHTYICLLKFPHIKHVILITKFPQSLKNFRDPGSPRSRLFSCLKEKKMNPEWHNEAPSRILIGKMLRAKPRFYARIFFLFLPLSWPHSLSWHSRVYETF